MRLSAASRLSSERACRNWKPPSEPTCMPDYPLWEWAPRNRSITASGLMRSGRRESSDANLIVPRPSTKRLYSVVACVLVFGCMCGMAQSRAPSSERIKVIADQDSAGPQGTNLMSLLMLLRARQVDLLGVTTVSGDQWVEPATVFALWATEITKRTDVPVIKGAELPLLNTRREQEAREKVYGSYVGWHGSFNPDAPDPGETWPPPGGYPKVKARPGRAADFIIDTVRANPGVVVLYCAGPLTNVALAVSMDPDIVALVKAIYIMGGSSAG